MTIIIITILYIIHINVIMIIKYMLKHDFAKNQQKKNPQCCTFLDILKKDKWYFCNQKVCLNPLIG